MSQILGFDQHLSFKDKTTGKTASIQLKVLNGHETISFDPDGKQMLTLTKMFSLHTISAEGLRVAANFFTSLADQVEAENADPVEEAPAEGKKSAKKLEVL